MEGCTPRVSIGMPVYKGERYVAEAIDSVLRQTFTDFELIISDNCSTDGTAEICAAYAAKDSRVRYYRNTQNRGVAWNYNRVFELARGDYFKWAAHDDVLAPAYLERCVVALDALPSVVLCHTKTVMIDEHWNTPFTYDPNLRVADPRPSIRFLDLIQKPGYCSHIHGLMRARVLRQTSLIGSFPSSDLTLLAHLVLLGPFHDIAEGLFFNRRHAEQSPRDRYLSAAWFNQSRVDRITLPQWTLLLEFFKAVWQAPLSPGERACCLYHLMQWTTWNRNWRRLGKDVARAAMLLAASFPDRKKNNGPRMPERVASADDSRTLSETAGVAR
jgi:glycosyltransferase involved in cell wall biosynthesis